ncbi:MAG: type IV secretion system protein [Novosphingobium sp.]
MKICPTFPEQGPSGIADALRNIDCVTGNAVETAFSRLFGTSSALSEALTLVLTIYIALLALSLLTGRTQLRLAMLTPRMLQLGLVLTLATSWVAYQSLGWNLLTGAPDEIAGVILGNRGSATQLFAQRLDVLFGVIANSAHLAQGANATATVGMVPAVANMSLKPADLLWLGSLMLLVGTVGVLIVARIALAAVMALGPVFIVLALFKGSRGLFEGWLRAAIMLALTPLFAVLIGGGTLVMAAPMIRSLARAGGQVSLGLATNIFLAAFVYLSLMALAMRAAAMITGSLRLAGGSEVSDVARDASAGQNAADVLPAPATFAASESQAATSPPDERVRELVRTLGGGVPDTAANDVAPTQGDRRTVIVSGGLPQSAESGPAPGGDPRVRSLGQGFRSPQRAAL